MQARPSPRRVRSTRRAAAPQMRRPCAAARLRPLAWSRARWLPPPPCLSVPATDRAAVSSGPGISLSHGQPLALRRAGNRGPGIASRRPQGQLLDNRREQGQLLDNRRERGHRPRAASVAAPVTRRRQTRPGLQGRGGEKRRGRLA